MIQNADITIVGNFSMDTILLPSRSAPFHVLGGSAAYTSFITRKLCASASVISKVGEDFPDAYLWWLSQEGVDLSDVKKVGDVHSTSFMLEYSKDLSERTLTLKSKGPPIDVSDIPSKLRSNAIHVAPIANEVSLEVVEKLKSCCDILSIDPQGLIRNFDENGRVTNSSQIDKRLLSFVTIYKSSIEEIYSLTRTVDTKHAIKAIHDLGVETVIATMGSKGALLSVEGTQYTIPVCLSKIVVDPTGAGDVFIGAFLNEYLKDKESFWCACVGVAAASTVLEGIGPTYFGEKDEIYQRASALYEKEIKQ